MQDVINVGNFLYLQGVHSAAEPDTSMSSTDGGVECTVGQPTTTPSASCALALDSTDGTLWQWYGGAWH